MVLGHYNWGFEVAWGLKGFRALLLVCPQQNPQHKHKAHAEPYIQSPSPLSAIETVITVEPDIAVDLAVALFCAQTLNPRSKLLL